MALPPVAAAAEAVASGELAVGFRYGVASAHPLPVLVRLVLVDTMADAVDDLGYKGRKAIGVVFVHYTFEKLSTELTRVLGSYL